MKNNKLNILSLVLGIISIICAFIWYEIIPYIGLMSGIVGIYAGVNKNKSKIKTAGFITSIVGISINAIYIIVAYFILGFSI